MNLTNAEKGYLAGFIDADGSFLINKREHIDIRNGSRYVSYSIYIDFGNTNKKVLEWIKGKADVTSKIYENPVGGNRKMAYRLRIAYKQAKPLTEIIIEHLIIKRERAEIFLSWPYEKRDKKSRQKREKLFQQMKKLNERGIQEV